MIKFLDLKQLNHPYEEEFHKKFEEFINSGYYIQGNETKLFENNFSSYCGTQYAIGTGNGLDAIRLILEAYKIKGLLQKGDEVLVPANTFIATILAVSQAGLILKLIEPNLQTYNINPDNVTKAISTKTKAVIGVHLYGQISEWQSLKKLCQEHQLLLIEDAAQAHGAIYKGKKAGNLGDAAAFSFYPTKNLGALGDAGIITTQDKDLADIIKKLTNYGQEVKYISKYKGFNSRLDEIQATFLNVKLKYLDKNNQKRRRIAQKYLTEINNKKITLPYVEDFSQHIFHQFGLRTRQRDVFQTFLWENGIQTLIHYPVPPHKQAAYNEWKNESLPITEKIHKEIISIPIRENLTQKEIEYIIKIINRF